jgi:hypothetical protein
MQLTCIYFLYNRVVCEIMWKKHGTAEQETDTNMIERACVACWINKATDTHSEYAIITYFPRLRGYVNAPACYVRHTVTTLFKSTT